MARNRTPQTSARESRQVRTYAVNRAASLEHSARVASYQPQSQQAALKAAWNAGKISYPQYLIMGGKEL